MFNTTLADLAKEKFDLFEFLGENGVDYSLEGKNIGEGWLGIYECFHCGIGNYHYGINIEEKYGTCWSCGLGDDLINIIKYILNINYYKAKEYLISSVYNEDDIEIQIDAIFNQIEPAKKEKIEKKIELPKAIELYKLIGKNKTITEFCQKRKITEWLAKDLDLHVSTATKYRNCLIIPIWHKRKFIGYQARSFTSRFFHNKGPLKHYLYQYDKIEKDSTIFIVEGFTDWTNTNSFLKVFRRYHKYYVTTPFSKILTDEQINIFQELEPKRAIFMLDYDAWYQYYTPSFKLFCDTDFVILPKDTDPGKMNIRQFLRTFIKYDL
jgi:hypothetical protein